MRQRQRDELRCAQRLRRGPFPSGASFRISVAGPEGCGAGRTRNEAGIKSAHAAMPITSIAVRQS